MFFNAFQVMFSTFRQIIEFIYRTFEAEVRKEGIGSRKMYERLC